MQHDALEKFRLLVNLRVQLVLGKGLKLQSVIGL